MVEDVAGNQLLRFGKLRQARFDLTEKICVHHGTLLTYYSFKKVVEES